MRPRTFARSRPSSSRSSSNVSSWPTSSSTCSSRYAASGGPSGSPSDSSCERVSAARVSGTVARMIMCCWTRYSGQSSGSRGSSTSASYAVATGRTTSAIFCLRRVLGVSIVAADSVNHRHDQLRVDMLVLHGLPEAVERLQLVLREAVENRDDGRRDVVRVDLSLAQVLTDVRLELSLFGRARTISGDSTGCQAGSVNHADARRRIDVLRFQ